MAEARPPFRARLHRYRLTPSEFCLLTAMLEHCSDGSVIWPSIARLAAYSKLSERNCQRTLRDLCSRGIISQLAPANSHRRRKPATYRINEAALEEDPKMLPYRPTSQQGLPGIQRASIPGGAVTSNESTEGTKLVRKNVQMMPHVTGAICHPTGASLAPVPVPQWRVTGDTVAPNPKSLDSTTSYPRTNDSNSGEFTEVFNEVFGEPCCRCNGTRWVASLSKPGRAVRCEACSPAKTSVSCPWG